jgi:acetyl-CoA carboxylase carboxyl transferase subunit beta
VGGDCADLTSNDPLKFTDTKPYKSRLAATQKSDRAEGRGDRRRRQGQRRRPASIASMEYSFIGGSMGRGGREEDRALASSWRSQRRLPVLIVVVLGRCAP